MPLPSSSWSSLLVLAVTACTSTEPPAPSGPPSAVEPVAPEPEPEPATKAPEPALVPNTLAWRWRSPRPVGELEYWIPMPVSIANGSTVIEATEREPGGVRITRTDDGRTRWTTPLGETFSNSAALASSGDAVLVAHYHGIATGTTVARLDAETGQVQWEHPLRGVGPIGHSKYHNAVQVELIAGVLHVFGRESHGAYVERVDIDLGQTLEHSMVPPALVALSWDDVPAREGPRPEGNVTVSDGQGTHVSIEGQPARIIVRSTDGERSSLPVLRDQGSCGTGDGVIHDGIAYLVYACAITSGAQAYAVSLADGTLRWQQSLHGLGSIAHSAYSNDVRIAWRDGVVLVAGDEAMGRYVEALEPSDGRILVTKSWPLP